MQAPREDKLIGRTLAGKYRVEELIGRGGMAAVYRSTQEGDPHEVAIKILDPRLSREEHFVRRFQREATSAARLKHRSTVRIFDHGVEGKLAYIVMELVMGAELVDILHHERRLPEARAARIIGQVCSALAAAHDLGIVHRDLKPENIMLLRDPKDPTVERVKVLDFGIAKIMQPEERPPDALPPDSDEAPPSNFGRTMLTMIGTIVGTPEYMSPEQSRGQPLDARSDVYSCGVLLFQLVTGKLPFEGDTPVATALLQATEPPRKPSELFPTINPKLEALILRALAKDPGERPQSAREMQEQLVELIPELASERHNSVPVPGDSRPRGELPVPKPFSVPPESDSETLTRQMPQWQTAPAPAPVPQIAIEDGARVSAAAAVAPAPPGPRAPRGGVTQPSAGVVPVVPQRRKRTGAAVSVTDIGAVALGIALGAIVIGVTASTTMRIGIGIVAVLIAATALVVALRR